MGACCSLAAPARALAAPGAESPGGCSPTPPRLCQGGGCPSTSPSGFWGDVAVQHVPAGALSLHGSSSSHTWAAEKGLRNALCYPAPCIAVFVLKVTVKQHPYYGDISRIAATGLPPALCFSGRGQQQEIKNCFYVASERCRLNEPTNPAVPARVLLALLSTRSIKLLTGCCL